MFVLRQNRLERMIRLLQPLLTLEDSCDIEIDLSRLVSISPAGLALLTAALQRVLNLRPEPSCTIVTPRHPGVRTYLQRMNLLRSLPGFSEIKEDFERHDELGFRGCRMFAGEDYAPTALEMIEAMTERCTMDDVATSAVRVCLDEIAENVGHHSEAAVGFAAAQGWRRSSELEIAIVDLGIGIRASLTKNPEYSSVTEDADAIETALQPRVTATPERNSGIGLFITRMLLKANGGSMIVRSGFGALHGGVVDRVESKDVYLPGTLVAIRVRTDKPLDVNSVYAQLNGPVDDDD